MCKCVFVCDSYQQLRYLPHLTPLLSTPLIKFFELEEERYRKNSAVVTEGLRAVQDVDPITLGQVVAYFESPAVTMKERSRAAEVMFRTAAAKTAARGNLTQLSQLLPKGILEDAHERRKVLPACCAALARSESGYRLLEVSVCGMACVMQVSSRCQEQQFPPQG